jgi:uncharacterized phage-associated protein
MELSFDIKKAMASVAFLAERSGGQLDMFLGLKSLYIADRQALIQTGKTITGDSFRSLPKGPVLLTVYKLFKGSAEPELQKQWDACFTERMNHSIKMKCAVSVDSLSDRDKEFLSIAQDEVNSMAPWDVADWLHKTCPEWEDPQGNSLPLPPEKILRAAGLSEDEIFQISESEAVFQETKRLLGAR